MFVCYITMFAGQITILAQSQSKLPKIIHQPEMSDDSKGWPN